MRNSVLHMVPLVAAVCLLAACGGRASKGASPAAKEAPKGMELLLSVPSDAAAVMCFERCGAGLEMMLDSADALRRCVPPKFAGSQMVMSWCYNGAVVPLLAIAAPRDTSSAVTAACENAAASGIVARYLSASEGPAGKGVLLLCRSESVVESAVRHIENGASILDAQGFADALGRASAAPALLFWNNADASKWLCRDALSGVFKRSDLVGFIKETAEWTVSSVTEVPAAPVVDFVLSRNASETWFGNFLFGLAPGESRVGQVLPCGTDFALTLVIADSDAFRADYTRHLDASVRLARYNSERSALKKIGGEDPEEWASKMSFREVALVRWGGHSVLLARPAKSQMAFKTSVNRHQHFLSLLYGKAFSLEDESAVASLGRWLVIGSSVDVDAFASLSERMDVSRWPSRSCRFVLYERNAEETRILSDNRQGMRLNVYKNR